ncbi:MAG: cell division protein FtsZ [Treponema sp.]|nr:cell division protein FtsZ [Treponema sp.]MBQ2552357.1 cell division protein FtsZ [Treponema sp.]MBQ4235809.1 cell division protein FtsZ [Treponema sp.]MBQ5383525.1 cell division protein FtsZ [Treponema sp.]
MIELSVEKDAGEALTAPSPTIIKIIGCGGGGSSAVNRMIDEGVSDVEFIVMNTDMQALRISKAQKRIPIGQQLTGGLGAGGNPEVGEKAAEEDEESITELVRDADMVIITAGMGGGTGTGSAPVVARIAKEQGCLTLAVVTTPFDFEASIRKEYASNGLEKLREHVDSLIVIPNQQIMKIVGNDRNITYKQAFRLADDVLCQGVMGITGIITKPGEVNCDFADVKAVMKDQGEAILGVGIAGGENRAVEAAQNAICNPMLENRSIDGASNILVNITSAEVLGMVEVEEIIKTISASANPRLKLFWGQVPDTNMGDKVSVTVIATGFEQSDRERSMSGADAGLLHGNVLPMDDFDVLMGNKKAEPVKKTPAVNEYSKISNIPVNPQIINDDSEKQADEFFSGLKVEAYTPQTRSNPYSMSEKFSNAVESAKQKPKFIPPVNMDIGDKNQPAVLRKLSRTIDLSSED